MKQNRKHKIINFTKKYGLRLWILVAVLSLSGMYTYAAYMNQQNKAKKVIVTSADSDMRFSSNYLEEGATKTKTVFMNAEGNSFTIPVNIRNFGRNNPSLYYASDINYQLFVELTNTAGITPASDAQYSSKIDNLLNGSSVSITFGNNTIVLNSGNKQGTFSGQTLTYNKLAAAENAYTVAFPSANTKICVRMVATPIPANNYPDLQEISVILSVANQATVQTNGWEGSFNDSSDKTPEEYDGFNYYLAGYGDSQTATFTWNATRIEVNRQYFCDQNKLNADWNSITTETINGETWKTVTINLNSEASHGRYDFQLFKTETFNNVSENLGEDPAPVTWNQLRSWVSFDDGID